MSTDTTTSTHAPVVRRADEGVAFSGPGDVYRFLVTGAETDGAYFAMEAIVPPGGGPPPHVHSFEDESFLVLEGECSIRLGDEVVTARAGDFVHVPRGTVHCFRNEGATPMRMVLTFTPSGMEAFFEESLERAPSASLEHSGDVEEVAARYVAAAPRHGLTFVEG